MDHDRVRTIAAGSLSGILGGVASGIAARVAMRFVALGLADASTQVPEFTVAGTLAILVSAAIAGAPLGAIYALICESLPGPRRSRGLLFGAILLAATGPIFFSGTDEFFSGGRIALFVWVFPVFGATVGLGMSAGYRIARSLPMPANAVLALMAAGGAVLIGAGLAGLAARSVEALGPMVVVWAASCALLVVLAARSGRLRLSAGGIH